MKFSARWGVGLGANPIPYTEILICSILLFLVIKRDGTSLKMEKYSSRAVKRNIIELK